MLYPTLIQPLVILMVFLAGLFSGLVFNLSKILAFLSGNDKYSKNIFDFLAMIFSFTVLFFVNLKFNYGQFRLYVLGVFLLSLIFEQFLSRALWTKAISKCYNKLVWKLKNKRKTKWKGYLYGQDLLCSYFLWSQRP